MAKCQKPGCANEGWYERGDFAWCSDHGPHSVGCRCHKCAPPPEAQSRDLAEEESKLTAYDDIANAVLASDGEDPHPQEVTERVLLRLRELDRLIRKQEAAQSPSSPAGSAMGDRATLDALLLELRNLADAWDGLSGSMSTSPELHVMAKGEAYARMVSALRGMLKEYALRRYDPSLNVQPETSKP